MSLDLQFEEDVELAVAQFVSALGKQGRMLPSTKTVNHNMRLIDGFGNILWYGDIDISEVHKVVTLAQTLGTAIRFEQM